MTSSQSVFYVITSRFHWIPSGWFDRVGVPSFTGFFLTQSWTDVERCCCAQGCGVPIATEEEALGDEPRGKDVSPQQRQQGEASFEYSLSKSNWLSIPGSCVECRIRKLSPFFYRSNDEGAAQRSAGLTLRSGPVESAAVGPPRLPGDAGALQQPAGQPADHRLVFFFVISFSFGRTGFKNLLVFHIFV